MAITYRGAGAAATANNAAVTPALPEVPTAGDLLLCLAYIRNDDVSGTVLGTPSGWTQRFQIHGSVSQTPGLALFYKIAAGGDSNPTVTPTGGGSGDDVIAQCASFRGVDTSAPFDSDGASYDSAAQVADIGPISGLTPGVSDAAVIVMGGKSDDWTSVATLTGDSLTWNEIGEPDAVAGSDAGMVWDYTIIVGAAVAITNKTFTITGGVARAAIGKMTVLKPSGGTVFNDTPAGTITLAGLITESASHDSTVAGTLTLSGTPGADEAHASTPSGTVMLSGSIVEFTGKQYDDSVSGSLTLTGVITESESHAASVSGTVTLSGSLSESYSTGGTVYNDSPSGTITLSAGASTRESITKASGFNNPETIALLPDGRMFAGYLTAPGKITKWDNPDDLATSTDLTFAADGKHNVTHRLTYIPATGLLYTVFQSYINADGKPHHVVEWIDPDDLSHGQLCDLNTAFPLAISFNQIAHATDGSYLYVNYFDFTAGGVKVAKIDPTTGSVLASRVLTTVPGSPPIGHAMEYDAATSKFFWSNRSSSQMAVGWVAADLSADDWLLATTVADNVGSSNTLCTAGSNIWVPSEGVGAVGPRVVPKDLSTTGSYAVTGHNESVLACLYDGTYVWVWLGSTPGRLIAFDPTTLVRVHDVPLVSGEDTANAAALLGDAAIVGCLLSPAIFVRVPLIELASGSDSQSGTIALSGSIVESNTIGGATYDDTPSGSVTLSGSIVESASHDSTVAGTIAFTGSIVESFTHSSTISGTITLSGSITESGSGSDTSSGSLSLTGAISASLEHSSTVLGTVTLSGTIAASESHAASATGTITLSGSIVESTAGAVTYNDVPSGTVTLSGRLVRIPAPGRASGGISLM
jgi:hypothetical protein